MCVPALASKCRLHANVNVNVNVMARGGSKNERKGEGRNKKKVGKGVWRRTFSHTENCLTGRLIKKVNLHYQETLNLKHIRTFNHPK